MKYASQRKAMCVRYRQLGERFAGRNGQSAAISSCS